jgi:hypothetical protein
MFSGDHSIACGICGHQAGREGLNEFRIGTFYQIRNLLPGVVHQGEKCCFQKLCHYEGTLHLDERYSGWKIEITF